MSEDDKLTVARARKIQKFLSQPFFVAEQFTGYKGKYVPIAETVRGFKEIVEGKHDEIPEQMFYMAGTIDDVLERRKKKLSHMTIPKHLRLEFVTPERVDRPRRRGRGGAAGRGRPFRRAARPRAAARGAGHGADVVPQGQRQTHYAFVGGGFAEVVGRSRVGAGAGRRTRRGHRPGRAPKPPSGAPRSGWPRPTTDIDFERARIALLARDVAAPRSRSTRGAFLRPHDEPFFRRSLPSRLAAGGQ